MGAFFGPGTTLDSYMVDSSRSMGLEIPFLKAPWNFMRRFCLLSAGCPGWTSSNAELWLVSWVGGEASSFSNRSESSHAANAASPSDWEVPPLLKSTDGSALAEAEPSVSALDRAMWPRLRRAERPCGMKHHLRIRAVVQSVFKKHPQ